MLSSSKRHMTFVSENFSKCILYLAMISVDVLIRKILGEMLGCCHLPDSEGSLVL